jgi:Outer membrane lipoprotein-sorting protein
MPFAMSDRRRFIRGLAFAALAAFQPVDASTDDARLLVERADVIRNPQQPFQVKLRLVEYRNGQARDSAVLQLHSKLQPETKRYRNLARFLEPAADVGKILLMDEESLWFFDPASSASIRISPQQRLVGQAANGDAMTANFAIDYKPRFVGEERIKDADNNERQTAHLELNAATGSALYHRIDYWIERETNLPIKARFFADSGRALKLAFYRRYTPQLGQPRAGEIIILDEVDTSVVTKLTFTDYSDQDTPDAWFNRDYLPRLRASDRGGASK